MTIPPSTLFYLLKANTEFHRKKILAWSLVVEVVLMQVLLGYFWNVLGRIGGPVDKKTVLTTAVGLLVAWISWFAGWYKLVLMNGLRDGK